MLLTVLKACLASAPGINDNMSGSSSQERSGLRGCLHEDVIEMICVKLREKSIPRR